MLGDLNNVAVNEDERARVIIAVLAILRSAANSTPHAADYVYTCILKSLDTLEEPVIDVSEDAEDVDPSLTTSDIMNSPISPKRSAPKARVADLRLGDATVAHLNLIRDVLLLDAGNPNGCVKFKGLYLCICTEYRYRTNNTQIRHHVADTRIIRITRASTRRTL